ncbi:MAG: ATP-binding protein [Solirubrobacteraceae bacterium]
MRFWRRASSRAATPATASAEEARAATDGVVLDLADLVTRRCEVWQPRFRARGKSLEVTVEPVAVAGAADELALVLDALLSNAMRFSDHGDHVCVVLRLVGEGALLEVSDTGIGMLPEEMGKVFDRFYRGSLGRDRALGGSGLGLTIARELARAHRGDISCDSVAGEGSAFRLRLPAAAPVRRRSDRKVVTRRLAVTLQAG